MQTLKTHLPEIAILFVAIFLRCWLIEIKPPHFDEGINGGFADRMTGAGYYRYDPENYHGPLHFYAVFLSQTLFGREVWALRLPAILASILAIWAMLRFREFFGVEVARLAALAMAVSPAFTFYGRYSIHESWQVLFSILLLLGLLGLWQTGTRKHLFLMATGITGMILTKETYVLHIGCMGIAATSLWIYQKMVPSRPAWPIAKQQWGRKDILLTGGISALAIVFFYSGTFRDFSALHGLYTTFQAWTDTGTENKSGHEKPSLYWLSLMMRYEWPALIGFAACLRYVLPSDTRYRYIAVMTGGVLLAYSLIPYKTPWCLISIIWPFYLILAGVLSEWINLPSRNKTRSKNWLNSLHPWERFLGCNTPRDKIWLTALPLLAVSLYSAILLNFYRYTDEKEPYAYVQTDKEIELLTEPLLKLAKTEPDGYQLSGKVRLSSTYPLSWILGDFARVEYVPKDTKLKVWDAGFVVIQASDAHEIERELKNSYYKIPFRLRHYQQGCIAYLDAKIFSRILDGKPNFIGGNPYIIDEKPYVNPVCPGCGNPECERFKSSNPL